MKICCSLCENMLDPVTKPFIGRLINEMNSLAAQLITMNEMFTDLKKLRPSKNLSQSTIDSRFNTLNRAIDEASKRHNELRNVYLSMEHMVFLPYGQGFTVQKS